MLGWGFRRSIRFVLDVFEIEGVLFVNDVVDYFLRVVIKRLFCFRYFILILIIDMLFLGCRCRFFWGGRFWKGGIYLGVYLVVYGYFGVR